MAGEPNVIVVPGIMGSRLIFAGGARNGVELWCDPDLIQGIGPGVLQLAADGDSPGPLAQGQALTSAAGATTWSPYGPLMRRLSADGWNATFYAYDWRKELTDTAAALADYLLGRYPTEDFRLVAHSMGGLLARLAYQIWRVAPHANNWKRTLYIGVPQYGCTNSCISAAKPAGSQRTTTPPLATLANPYALGAWLRQMYEANRQLPPTVASWPALYALWPALTGPFHPNSATNGQLYQAATFADANPAVSSSALAFATSQRAALDTALAGPQPPSRTVVGTGLPTAGDYLGGVLPGQLNRYASVDGDGVVPTVRATAGNFSPSLSISPGDHRALPMAPAFLFVVSELLGDDTIAPTESFAGPVIAAPISPPQQLSTIEFPGIPGTGTQQLGDPF